MLPASPLLIFALYVVATLAGLGAGMVVNALAERIAGDEDPPWRSGTCRACHKPLPRTRLIPLVGVFRMGRRCPACGAGVGLRRPVVEAALALAFPLILAHTITPDTPPHLAPLAVLLVDLVVVTTLALTFVVDLEHHLILDVVVYPVAAGLVLVALALDHKALAAMAVGALVSGGLFLLFYVLGFILYRQEALGFGDVKLAALIGMAVGWPGIVSALILCAFIGGAATLALLTTGRVTTRTYIPFGTFLSLGAALALLVTAPFW